MYWVAEAVLCIPVGERYSVTRGRSRRPKDGLKPGSSLGRTAFN